MDALSIAVSGLTAQKQKLAATSNNIANALTAGTIPNGNAAPTAGEVYRPLDVSFTALTVGQGQGAGVRADVFERVDGYSLVYDPASIHANTEGYYAVPNIDFAEDITDMIVTKTAYKANIATLKTYEEMSGELLDILS